MLRSYILLACLCAFPVCAQTTNKGRSLRVINGDTMVVERTGDNTTIIDSKTGRGEVFTYIEQMPEPPYNINNYIAASTRYPDDAKKAGTGGRVLVRFLVRKDGSIDSVRILKPVFPSLDREALRLIRTMPPWKPGKQNGLPVEVNFTLPVTFNPE